MAKRSVNYTSTDGNNGTLKINVLAVQCPYCDSLSVPDVLYGSYSGRRGYRLFCRCVNTKCEGTFVCALERNIVNGSTEYSTGNVQSDIKVKRKEFSTIISEISTNFVEIYNQAYAPQQMGLSDICGVGYRKALEFLIKDYAMSLCDNEDMKNAIKSKNLAKCIGDDIDNIKIKEVSKRATWLGNDETHYIRKWEEKDVKNLITTIELTTHWIESEVETQKLLSEMAEPK